MGQMEKDLEGLAKQVVSETWALAKGKRCRRWEQEPRPSCGRKPPSSVSHSGGSPVLWPFLLFPGLHGGVGEREGDKLVA